MRPSREEIDAYLDSLAIAARAARAERKRLGVVRPCDLLVPSPTRGRRRPRPATRKQIATLRAKRRAALARAGRDNQIERAVRRSITRLNAIASPTRRGRPSRSED